MTRAASAAVLVCFDDNYAPAACVTLNSVFRNNRELAFGVYAGVASIRPEYVQGLKTLCARFGRAVTFIEFEPREFSHFKIGGYFSHASYFSILAIDRVPTDRIVYLDVDLIVQTDLSPLSAMDLADKLVAGVAEELPLPDLRDRLGMPRDEPYINTGVLVINAALWRREDTTRQLLDYHERNLGEIRWVDQDVINGSLVGRKMLIDGEWNVTYRAVRRGTLTLPHFDAARFRGIFHFTGSDKPWHDWFDPRFRPLYHRYAETAPIRMSETTMPRYYRHSLRYALLLRRRGRIVRALAACRHAVVLLTRKIVRA